MMLLTSTTRSYKVRNNVYMPIIMKPYHNNFVVYRIRALHSMTINNIFYENMSGCTGVITYTVTVLVTTANWL